MKRSKGDLDNEKVVLKWRKCFCFKQIINETIRINFDEME